MMTNANSLLQALAQTIQQGGSVHTAESGVIDAHSVGLKIHGIGDVKLPLRPKDARKLLASAEMAPYGKGTETILDKSVRDCLEVPASKITLSDAWNAAVQSAARESAERLGLPADRVQARLYKLLIYPRGGFFLPHRDSEKNRGMVGSLVAMLPSPFSGGELIVQHGESRESFPCAQAAAGKSAEYVAFYADCQHEVRPVTRGVRVCLSYNLIVKPQKRLAGADPDAENADPDLVASITHWTESRPREPMVFALEHLYTADGLKLDLLKGNDRRTARQLVEAAEAAGCRAHFGQVSRRLLQAAEDGSYGRWQHRDADDVDYEVGETYEDDVRVDQWRDAHGKRVAMDSLPLNESMLVSTTPLEEWKPTKEEYEGYTGNEGNTLERWYHKSAVVVWSARDHFDVLVRTGVDSAVKAFLKLQEELPRLPEDELEQACNDCVSLAGAIIRGWPERSERYGARKVPEEDRHLLEFAAELPKLEDPELVGEFLQSVARRDGRLPLGKLILDCCRRFGADVMAPVLEEALLVEPARSWRVSEMECLARDAVWLRVLACDRSQGGMSADQLARLIGVAASRLGDGLKATARYKHGSRDVDDGGAIAELMKAALAAGDESGFSELLKLRRDLPDAFEIRDFDIQVCGSLIKWADKRFDRRPAALTRWLAEIREFLEASTREPPQPPTDFARSADTNCTCALCQELAVFLNDPTPESGRIKSRKHELEHLQNKIREQKLDVDATLDRNTRPFALVLVKTTNSHKRAVELHNADQARLSSLAQW